MSDSPQALAQHDRQAIAVLRRLFPEADVDPSQSVGDYRIALPHGSALLNVEMKALDRMNFRIEMVAVHRDEPGDPTFPAVMVTDERAGCE